DRRERLEQALERAPAADLFEDQAVLDERAIRERRHGIRHAKPAPVDKPAGDGAVAEERDAVRTAEFREAALGPPIEYRPLELVRRQWNSRADDLSQVRGIEVRRSYMA